MIDTLRLHIDRNSVSNTDLLAEVPCYLSDVEEHAGDNTFSMSGNLENFYIKVYESRVNMTGSLAKYHLGNNYKTLTRQDIELAIEKLSDEVHLPIKEADVRRLDIAQNFVTKFPPNMYFQLFGDAKGFQRAEFPHSIYYNKTAFALVCYDKIAEGKAKLKGKFELPEIWQDLNILRFEQRYLKHIPKSLGMNEVKAEHLYDEEFYIQLLDSYVEAFHSITKMRRFTMDLNQIRKPKDFWEMLLVKQVSEMGLNEINKMISVMKDANTFENKEYYSVLKRRAKELSGAEGLTDTSELISELDTQINRIKDYYR